ncbi:MAG: RNA polymerase sigma factor [Saprospiraceae bacterium]
MEEISDQQLIKECLKGDQRSFKALYERYQGYVYSICIRYAVSPQAVKDQMQVIFMETFQSLDRYDSTKAAFKTWMTRIAINQIIHQKRKRNFDYSVESLEDYSVINSEYHVSVDWEIDQKELYAILNKMPEKYATAFNLSIIEGYSHSEIAELLGVPQSTTRVLVHRGRIWAMNQLKVYLQDTTTPCLKLNP